MPFGIDDAIAGVLGGASLLQGAGAQDKANAMQDAQLRLAQQRYTETLPFRERAGQGLMQPLPQAQNLDGIFGMSGNPYARSGHVAPLPMSSPTGAPGAFGGNPSPPQSSGGPLYNPAPMSQMPQFQQPTPGGVGMNDMTKLQSWAGNTGSGFLDRAKRRGAQTALGQPGLIPLGY